METKEHLIELARVRFSKAEFNWMRWDDFEPLNDPRRLAALEETQAARMELIKLYK
jgi:hypothetical protein